MQLPGYRYSMKNKQTAQNQWVQPLCDLLPTLDVQQVIFGAANIRIR
jgi:hypothetical protein